MLPVVAVDWLLPPIGDCAVVWLSDGGVAVALAGGLPLLAVPGSDCGFCVGFMPPCGVVAALGAPLGDTLPAAFAPLSLGG